MPGGELKQAEIIPLKNAVCKLIDPDKRYAIKDSAGQDLSSDRANDLLSFELKAGESAWVSLKSHS